MITIEAGKSIFLAGQAVRGHVPSRLGWRTRQRNCLPAMSLVLLVASRNLLKLQIQIRRWLSRL